MNYIYNYYKDIHVYSVLRHIAQHKNSPKKALKIILKFQIKHYWQRQNGTRTSHMSYIPNTCVVANTIIIICSWWHFHFRISICLFLPIDAVQEWLQCHVLQITIRKMQYFTGLYAHRVRYFFFVVWLCAQRVNKMKNCTSKVEIIINGPSLFSIYYIIYCL